MLCFKCSLKKECNAPCDSVENYLREKRNYKTTYVNKEIGISEVAMNKKAIDDYLSNGKNSQNDSDHARWMMLQEIIYNDLTKKQRTAIRLYLDCIPMKKIGRIMGVSGQTVHSSIFGHPINGGGAVRKIRKVLSSSDKYKTN